MKDTLSHRIRVLRGSESQEKFSLSIGISLRAYKYYESGDRIPPARVLSKLARVTGKSIDWILTGKEEKDVYVREGEVFYSVKERDDLAQKIFDLIPILNKGQKQQVINFIKGLLLLSEHDKDKNEAHSGRRVVFDEDE
jgi:transcriptional regulator with XRE-family HTH domain